MEVSTLMRTPDLIKRRRPGRRRTRAGDARRLPSPDRHADPELAFRGWVHLGTIGELRRNGVTNRRRFGRDVVVWVDTAGGVHATESTCPHFGAHLGGGDVVDGCLRCPLHHWHFDGDGAVQHVPNAKRLPPRARLDTIPVVVVADIAFMYQWAPDDDRCVAPPPMHPDVIDALHDRAGWVRSTMVMTADTTLAELGENAVDQAHFAIVHGKHIRRFGDLTLAERGDGAMTGRAQLTPRFGPFGGPTAEWDLVGVDPLTGLLRTSGRILGRLEYLTFVAPAEANRMVVLFVVKTARRWRGYDAAFHFVNRWQAAANIRGDNEVLLTKVHLRRPILSDADSQILLFRRWFDAQRASTVAVTNDDDAPRASSAGTDRAGAEWAGSTR